jgi:3'-phosphoadenosine 5'-phosphosulfate sulfotransferase (PAPS reductase)/FAD synthetase
LALARIKDKGAKMEEIRKEEIGKSVEERAMRYGPISHFTDIEAWKLARKLRIAVYRIIPKLPIEEKYDLASQLRRAAVSCTANIAGSAP